MLLGFNTYSHATPVDHGGQPSFFLSQLPSRHNARSPLKIQQTLTVDQHGSTTYSYHVTGSASEDIIYLLPYPTLQVLHATHPHFQTVIDFQKIQASTPRISLIQELISAAKSDAFFAIKYLFPCSECLRLLPRDHFADNARKKHLFVWFCIKCGLKSRYQPGARIDCMGTPGVYCLDCKLFKQGQAEVAEKSQPWCAKCLESRAAERRRLEEVESRRLEEERLEHLKRIKRQRQAEEKQRLRDFWGSDYDSYDDSEDETPSELVGGMRRCRVSGR